MKWLQDYRVAKGACLAKTLGCTQNARPTIAAEASSGACAAQQTDKTTHGDELGEGSDNDPKLGGRELRGAWQMLGQGDVPKP